MSVCGSRHWFTQRHKDPNHTKPNQNTAAAIVCVCVCVYAKSENVVLSSVVVLQSLTRQTFTLQSPNQGSHWCSQAPSFVHLYPLSVSIHPLNLSSLPHHADLGHLSLQLGSRHVLKVVVVAALPAPRVRLHDEVLHVQRSARDPCRVCCLAHWRAELGRSLVPGLLGQNEVLSRTAFVSLWMQIRKAFSSCNCDLISDGKLGIFDSTKMP